VKLMERLEAKIKEEGSIEAAAYDKFACFCKEQADEKLFSITKKKGRIAELSAIIKKCTADIESFTSDMEAAKKRKEELEAESKQAASDRKDQNADFLASKADRIQGINEILEALEEVKLSAEKQAGLIQVSERTRALLEEAGAADPGDAKAYAFKGGETIETLQKLHKEFKQLLKELMEEEAENKHTYDMAEGARNNEIMAKEALIAKCQDVIGKRTTEKSEASAEKGEQTSDKEEDEDFLKELTDECEEKAVKWDRRSKRRVNELTAIAKALDILKGDALDKYGSNKLALAQVKVHRHRRAVHAIMHHKKGHWAWKQDPVAMSFLQIASEPKKDEAKKKVLSNLARQASLLKSSTLEALVMALEDNPFESVKKMIEDLITKIDDEQSAEDDEIEACKNDINDNTKKRAKNGARMEEEEATIVEETAAIAEHADDAKELGKEVSQLYKDLNEATQLREKEKKQNTAVLEDATAGKESMVKAIKVLKEFYDSEALIQKSSKNKKDQPEIEDGSAFLGDDPDGDVSHQDDAKGIFGLLGTIKDDYESTIDTVGKEEEDAEKEYNGFKSDVEKEIDDKKAARKDKQDKGKQAEADIEQAKIDLASWTAQKKEAEYELSILTPRCLGLGASAEERKKRREEEKKALQDAITILDAMGPAAAPEPSEEFLQIKRH